jgi:hypothetical protein
LCMFLRSGIIYWQEFNMKSSYILNKNIYSISWPLVFWINIKINWHCHYFNFGLSSHPILNIKKPNVLSHHSYFTTKKGDETYEQQCDFIFKSKHLWF